MAWIHGQGCDLQFIQDQQSAGEGQQLLPLPEPQPWPLFVGEFRAPLAFAPEPAQGGFVQGMGFALYEAMVWDGARLANPSLLDYKIPTSADSPHIHSIIIEDPEPTGPFGAKGAGEISLNAIPAAIANAVNSVCPGLSHALPLTGERVLERIEESDNAA
ncbi:MAG: hypothetical protein EBY45_11755 [Gammaproteobacteria bacterium]|nr:hypothetical protein [Gammaproteobacteria bacterium]